MKTILQINSSLNGAAGASSQLANHFVEHWRQVQGGARLLLRDLAIEPVPHLDAARFAAFSTPAEQRDPAQQAAVRYSDSLIGELRQADAIVIGLPMYNFGVPSTLKAYFDHLARAGETFRYTSDGPQGLLEDKPVIVLATRGGRYAGTVRDTQSAYLRDFLAFIGLRELHFIYAEGLALGEAAREASLQEARRTIAAWPQRALAA